MSNRKRKHRDHSHNHNFPNSIRFYNLRMHLFSRNPPHYTTHSSREPSPKCFWARNSSALQLRRRSRLHHRTQRAKRLCWMLHGSHLLSSSVSSLVFHMLSVCPYVIWGEVSICVLYGHTHQQLRIKIYTVYMKHIRRLLQSSKPKSPQQCCNLLWRPDSVCTHVWWRDASNGVPFQLLKPYPFCFALFLVLLALSCK